MEVSFDVDKKYSSKRHIKRIEIDYKDMQYIIVNLEEKVIDVNGELRKFSISDDVLFDIESMLWSYENIDEYSYWRSKEEENTVEALLWRIAWVDEFDVYYHKSGSVKYPDSFEKLILCLKNLK